MDDGMGYEIRFGPAIAERNPMGQSSLFDGQHRMVGAIDAKQISRTIYQTGLGNGAKDEAACCSIGGTEFVGWRRWRWVR